MSIERELRAGLEGVAWGPFDTSWRHFKTMVFARDFEGGDCRVADIRGWGYLTGKGHGALGLDPKDAAKISDALGDFIARCSPENIRALLDELSRLRTALEPFAKVGRSIRGRSVEYTIRGDGYNLDAPLVDANDFVVAARALSEREGQE